MWEEDYKKLFKIAINNDFFKKIVDDNNLKDDCLKSILNYNNIFDFIQSENTNCSKGTIKDCKQVIKGQRYIIVFNKGMFYLNTKPCEHTLKLKQNPEAKFIYKNFELRSFCELNESLFLPLMDAPLKHLKDILANKETKGFFIHWSTYGGVSKFMKYSSLLISNQYKLIQNKSNVIYYDSLPEIILSIKDGFNNEMSDFSISRVKKAKVLFLEDVGKEMASVWTRDEVLYSILKYRNDNNLLTFIDSEFSLKELNEIYKGLIDVTRRVNHSVSEKRSKDIVEMIKSLCKVFEI